MTKNDSFFNSRAAILGAIPHRPPFLFVDTVNEITEDGIVCSYTFKEDEFFFQGHYPGFPIVPGVILCESAMQAGAIFTRRLLTESEADPGKLPVVGRMNDIKFKSIVRPGQTVEHHVTLKEKMAGAFIFKDKTLCEGKTAVSFEFIVAFVENED